MKTDEGSRHVILFLIGLITLGLVLFCIKDCSHSNRTNMWGEGQIVEVTGYHKHKCVVKKCLYEHHRIIAHAQVSRFKEAKENLPEGYYLVGEGIADISRA